ncbi:hypothetical protein GMLC_39160 [Geomonas limicola]|uniref:PilC beta-propeller domain-containing protein n=1 Tax=Geomonas limicola TaxID=2740186 RepID=A0A6V8NEY4_9BACT|nr:pilus assembly protein PilY [Geomonas limicola]GFO70337.1 hypothetical protein GMLC_39160 [Geomonas limicola]
METRYPGGAAGRCLIVLLCSLVLAGVNLPAWADVPGIPSARNYCSVPPLAGSGIKPNLLLMIDNSASMYDLAYTTTSTESPTYCLDDSYDNNASYLGYFQPELSYRYDFGASRFEIAADPTGIPAAERCGAARTDYLCVNTVPDVTALGTSYQRVDNFLARGNFLNWLVMSKLDLEKRALTGGKYDPATGLLSAETRGCQGKRFVKMVGTIPITFAVRGPIPSEPEYSYQSGRGGLSRIEIYANLYNRDACLAAITAWRDGAGVAALSQAALGCLSNQYDADGTPSKGKVYTEIMADCYTFFATGSLSFDPKLLDDCQARIDGVYGGNPFDIVKNTGDDVCGRGVFHHLTTYQGKSYSNGYLGSCYDLTFGYGSPMVSSCLERQTLDYCKDLAHPWLTDPSVTANMTGTTLNVPGFILDAGISNLGEVSGTLVPRVPAASAPTGLVQKYGNQINFGAMVFNDNGAGSECGDESSPVPCVKHCQYDPAPRRECAQASDCLVASRDACREDPHLDGGRVISYLNHSPLGDHTPGSGLIAAIDAVNANSWTPWAEAFYEAIGYYANRTDLRLQAADFDETWIPSQYSCQKNNILMVTDGMSTADRARVVSDYLAGAVRNFGGGGGMPSSQTTSSSDQPGTGPPFQGSYNVDDLAWIANHTNINDPSRPIQNNRDFITSYVVYTGVPCGDPTSGAGYLPDGSCSTGDEGVPEKLMQLVATKGGGRFLNVQRPADLASALSRVFQQIGSGSSAGTDASIISSGDANGALYLQEQFYPAKSFDGGASSASWIGEMQALWYYLDPLLGSSGTASTIREDTGGFLSLDLKRDRVVRFSYDPGAKETRATLYQDANGDGSADLVQTAGYPRPVTLEALQSLWRAGLQLWSRDPQSRTIYTQTDGSNLTTLSSDSTDQRVLLQAASLREAAEIVSYVRGEDAAETRSRSVARTPGGERRVWKLGDIISSTPAVQSVNPLAGYSLTPPRGYGDPSYRAFLKGGAYQGRGTVYLGANDGMLHAFRLGTLQLTPQPEWSAGQRASLEGTDLGREEWAFVPRNALPYLRYLKEPDYPHLYYVDGSPTLVDAAIAGPVECSRDGYWNCPKDDAGSSWRTVLIGGMGQGGATRSPAGSCSEGGGGTCVKSPRTDAGFSAYFALDVTGQRADGKGAAPRLLWEFAPPGLGFATSGPAILKINAARDGTSALPAHTKNGRWFAVFASGPTGSIDPDLCQFQGTSDQNLKLFVVDLNPAGPLVLGVNYWVIDTGIANAFGGSLSGAGIDADRWSPVSDGFYQDDALYLGYTRKAGDGSWTGGVLRLLTRERLDPATWQVSRVIDGIGPVTGSISKLQDRRNNKLWLYFGTGRYFYNRDDLSAGRALFGVQEPCYRPDNTLTPKDGIVCTAAALGVADLYDASRGPVPAGSDTKGWWIGLDPAADGYGSERFTANPGALTGGVVYFPSFKPASDPCRQGSSYLWGVRYDTAGSAPRSGKGLVPLSDASTAELSLSGWSDRDGRRSEALSGKPGNARLVTNSGLKPLKKIIHIQER